MSDCCVKFFATGGSQLLCQLPKTMLFSSVVGGENAAKDDLATIQHFLSSTSQELPHISVDKTLPRVQGNCGFAEEL